MGHDHQPRSTRRTRWAALAVVAAVAIGAAVPTAAAASRGQGATIIRGIQLAYGTCGGGTGYQMTGALDGCWWIDTFEPRTDPTRHTLIATGVEHFEGWIGAYFGTITTRYEYSAKMDGPWVSSAEIHGRCHHPITGGTGDFAGASGELSFTDVVDVDPPYYPYWGNIRVPGLGSLTVASSSSGVKTSLASPIETTASSC